MEPFFVTVVAIRAFGLEESARLLTEAAAALSRGANPGNENIQFMQVDPGGGGGPCAPQWIQQPIHVSPAGLQNPNAEPR